MICIIRMIKGSLRFGYSQVRRVLLPDLKYGYSALEPILSSKLMEYRHKKHHQMYVNNVNAALGHFQEAKQYVDLNAMASLSQTIKFNLGGHINHCIQWQSLAPVEQGGGQFPLASSQFTGQVIKQFGSFEKLVDELTKRLLTIQGSGWGWLAYDLSAQSLVIIDLSNQQMLQPLAFAPLLRTIFSHLAIDVWEHAYYLDYRNARSEYIKQIWNIINWNKVEKRYLSVVKKSL